MKRTVIALALVLPNAAALAQGTSGMLPSPITTGNARAIMSTRPARPVSGEPANAGG